MNLAFLALLPAALDGASSAVSLSLRLMAG